MDWGLPNDRDIILMHQDSRNTPASGVFDSLDDLRYAT